METIEEIICGIIENDDLNSDQKILEIKKLVSRDIPAKVIAKDLLRMYEYKPPKIDAAKYIKNIYPRAKLITIMSAYEIAFGETNL